MESVIEKKYHLVAGASPNPTRYSHMAVQRLQQSEKLVIAWGLREAHIGSVAIETSFPQRKDIHTITLYMNPQRQKEWYDGFLKLEPKRIIFNPGTENPELIQLAQDQGIECIEACTLVMLASNTYDH